MIKNFFFSIVFVCAMLASCTGPAPDEIVNLNREWKFITGDSLAYANPAFDDSKWKTLDPTRLWELQGYPDYDGYAWYRIKFILPSSMKKTAYFKDSVQLILDVIDDTEQTYLNGKLLGQNGTLVNEKGDNAEKEFINKQDAYRIFRKYVIPANDSRLSWDKENVIAVRVNDHGGGGGMYGSRHEISMVDIKDYLAFDVNSSSFNVKGKDIMSKGSLFFSKAVKVNNLSRHDFPGTVQVIITDMDNNKQVFFASKEMTLAPNASGNFEFEFNASQVNRNQVNYRFTEKKSGKTINSWQDIPYILTPKPADNPRINGARVYGQRPNRPFLFLIPATGLKPITFATENLPEGLQLDSKTGIISGAVNKIGTYLVKITASNEKGKAERELKIVIGDKLALTPPMGWNSWNCWGLSVDAGKVRDAADQMVSSGLASHGWTYINIDDGWEVPKRMKNGEIVPNEKFPDMKAVTGYVHSKGLKMGIYSSPGPKTCGGFLGSWQHELQDAQSWAKWGIDYIKYDWCSYGGIAKNSSLEELKKPYQVMRAALDKVDRDIVFSLCQYGMGDVWKWGAEVGGNLWRTTGDITDTWESMSGIGFNQTKNTQYAIPGHWNDPDMLVTGWVGWGPSLHPTHLTASEQYTHISLWALLSAPMLIGCDLTKLDDFTLNLLSNDEVLEIDQDALGKQASPLDIGEKYQVWVKDLEDGTKAAGLFNLGQEDMMVSIAFEKMQMQGKHAVRDLWRQKDLGEFEGKYESKVPGHGVVMIKIR